MTKPSHRDLTLEQRPDDFIRVVSPAKVIIWSIVLVVGAGVLIYALTNYDDIVARGSEATGRRSGLKGLAGPGLVLLGGLFAIYGVYGFITDLKTWGRKATGAAMKGREFVLDSTREQAQQWFDAFASGDPKNYLPISSSKKGDLRIRIWTPKDEKVVFVTVQHTSEAWPLITLGENTYGIIKGWTIHDFGQPYKEVTTTQSAVD